MFHSLASDVTTNPRGCWTAGDVRARQAGPAMRAVILRHPGPQRGRL